MDPDHECGGCMNRRNFLLVSLAAAAAAGCQGVGGAHSSPTGQERTIDAGPAANYAADGVYSNFRDEGFFIIRRGALLEAISSICTHRAAKLTAEEDGSFYCERHGSTFDPNGKVTDGPATRNLPVFTTFTNENGHLVVKIPA